MSRVIFVRSWRRDSPSASANVPPQASRADSGFTLIELAVSMAILSIVSVLAMSILVSTRNISRVVSWQSASNFELRQLIDTVFADVETARPAMGCDTNSDGRADTTTVSSDCGAKMVERADPVLLIAGPNRLCYYSNRLQTRTTGSSGSNYNPAYVPVCLAVVGTTLRLEQFDAPTTDSVNWNRSLVTGSVPTYRALGTVDPSPEGYFQYFKANSTNALVGTDSATVVGTSTPDTGLLVDTQRALVNSVLLRVRLKLGSSAADSSHTRDVAYRITLRSARYSAERCGLGNIETGISCSAPTTTTTVP
jgi:prepilin-type N-terminal cleavage/methylation domain-containing protein